MQVETIRDLVQRGASRHPELRCKIEHAAFIALFRQVSPELDGTWRVGSEREPDRIYRVRLDAEHGAAYCSCQDSQRHVGEECKHSLAAVMFSRCLLGLERHTVFDEPAPDPTPIIAPRPVASIIEREPDQYDRIFNRFNEGA